jgi:hypothetical protein
MAALAPSQLEVTKKVYHYNALEDMNTIRRMDCNRDLLSNTYVNSARVKTVKGELYITTNEINVEETLKKIKGLIERHPIGSEKSKLGIGCSGLHSLNILSLEKLDEIIIFDCAENVGVFWKDITKLIEANKNVSDAEKAIEKYIKELPKKRPDFFKNKEEAEEITEKHIANIKQEIAKNISFLSSQERYGRIRKVIINRKFSFHLANVNFPETFTEINEKVNKAVLRILYISNIRDYKSRPLAYIQLFKGLLNPNTILVDAHFCESSRYEMVQNARIAGFSDLRDEKTALCFLLHCSGSDDDTPSTKLSDLKVSKNWVIEIINEKITINEKRIKEIKGITDAKNPIFYAVGSSGSLLAAYRIRKDNPNYQGFQERIQSLKTITELICFIANHIFQYEQIYVRKPLNQVAPKKTELDMRVFAYKLANLCFLNTTIVMSPTQTEFIKNSKEFNKKSDELIPQLEKKLQFLNAKLAL